MKDKYTKWLYEAISIAEGFSNVNGLKYVGTEQLLYALLKFPNSEACKCLASSGVTLDTYRNGFARTLNRNSTITGYTPRAKWVINEAEQIAESSNFEFVSTEHLLLSILNRRDSKAATILRGMEIDYEALVDDATEMVYTLSKNRENEEYTTVINNGDEEKVKSIEEDNPLNKFGFDLTEKAKMGKLDPVIGRQKEIERIIQSLSRKTKNSPVLIGEPGVGKSAVVEGLAHEIAMGRVPDTLRGKIIFSINISGLLAGTKYRGEFEERFQEAINYVVKQGNIILFIDEIHNIMGAGSTGESNMDLAEMLKPMLARGEIQTIGATTIDEYRKYIEPDSAMERRFQPIMVEAPDKESAVLILKGIKDKFEAHHNVVITDEAIRAAVNLSDRYITDRNLPDKAIDLIDEAAAKAKLRFCFTPTDISDKQAEIRKLYREKDYRASLGDYNQAQKIQEKINKIKDEIDEIENRILESRSGSVPAIGENDIAEVISEWTNIPLTKLSQSESLKLMSLEEDLRDRVIGQDLAISAVSRAIKRARANVKDHNKPIGTFIFVGPTGVGKTELSKAIANVVFGNESNLLRIDMSEFMDKSSVSKLIGAPPGLVGYDEAGVLDKVRRNPYMVVLFDEIEKANPEIFNIMLQILDEGRLTDNKGKLISFKNAVIILTSNVGADLAKVKPTFGFANAEEQEDELRDNIYEALKRKFSPEFLNRLDDIIVFHALSKEDCGKIVELLISQLQKRLLESNIEISVAASAIDFIIEEGYDENYGARPLRRAIQKHIEDMIAEEIISGRIEPEDSIMIFAEYGRIRYQKKN